MLIEKTCERCGKKFNVIPYRGDKARFCSQKCYHAYRTKMPPKQELERLYWTDKLSTTKIGKRCGARATTVSAWMRKYGIPRRTLSQAASIGNRGKILWNKGLSKETCEIIRRYSERQSRERKGKCTNTGRTHFKKGHSLNRKYFIAKERLESLYLDKKLSGSEIAKRLSIPKDSVYKLLRKHRIPARTNSEAKKIFYKKHPEYVNMLIENSKNAGKHPNKSELKLLNILKKASSNWRFVGNGSFVVEGRCPDFWDGDGKLVEFWSEYWHQGQDPQERIDFFKKHGYECAVVWGHELKDGGALLGRLRG